MNVLALDTSTDTASVVLSYRQTLYVAEQANVQQHAERLLPMVAQVLQEAGAQMFQLDGIAFGCGPGSFTGLRIGCAVAKGLGFAHDIPLYPVSDLQAVAYEAFMREPSIPSNAWVVSMIDARMQQVYWAAYDKYFDLKVEEQVSFPQDIQVWQDVPLVLAGFGMDVFKAQLPANLYSRVIHQQSIVPHAQAMVSLVQKGLCAACDAKDAMPSYVRNNVASKRSDGG